MFFNISQGAVDAVVKDIQTGDSDYVEQFFVNRPEWEEQDKIVKQVDNKQKVTEEE